MSAKQFLGFEERMTLVGWLKDNATNIQSSGLNVPDILMMARRDKAISFDPTEQNLRSALKYTDIKLKKGGKRKLIEVDKQHLLVLATALVDLYLEVGSTPPKILENMKDELVEKNRNGG